MYNMSSKEHTITKPLEVTEIVTKKEDEKQNEPIVETMIREDETTKKCCSIMKEEVHVAFKCCAYTWCVSLNGIECCCVGLSKMCILMSDLALCCNKALEQIDCDKH